MKFLTTLSAAATITVLAVGIATAAPCATGTTTDSTGRKSTGDVTSNVDGNSTAKVTPGAKSESPGTVGAMGNVGANTMPSANEAKPAQGQVVKPGDDNC